MPTCPHCSTSLPLVDDKHMKFCASCGMIVVKRTHDEQLPATAPHPTVPLQKKQADTNHRTSEADLVPIGLVPVGYVSTEIVPAASVSEKLQSRYCSTCASDEIVLGGDLACPKCKTLFVEPGRVPLSSLPIRRKSGFEKSGIGRSMRDYPLGWGLIGAVTVIALLVIGVIVKSNRDREYDRAVQAEHQMLAQAEAERVQTEQAQYAAQQQAAVAAQSQRENQGASASLAAQYTSYDHDAIAAFLSNGGDSDAYYSAKAQIVSSGVSASNAAAYLYWVARNGNSTLKEKLYVSIVAVARCSGDIASAQSIISTLDRYDSQNSGTGAYAIATEAAQGHPFMNDVGAFRLSLWGTGNNNSANNDNGRDFESAVMKLAPP